MLIASWDAFFVLLQMTITNGNERIIRTERERLKRKVRKDDKTTEKEVQTRRHKSRRKEKERRINDLQYKNERKIGKGRTQYLSCTERKKVYNETERRRHN